MVTRSVTPHVTLLKLVVLHRMPTRQRYHPRNIRKAKASSSSNVSEVSFPLFCRFGGGATDAASDDSDSSLEGSRNSGDSYPSSSSFPAKTAFTESSASPA